MAVESHHCNIYCRSNISLDLTFCKVVRLCFGFWFPSSLTWLSSGFDQRLCGLQRLTRAVCDCFYISFCRFWAPTEVDWSATCNRLVEASVVRNFQLVGSVPKLFLFITHWSVSWCQFVVLGVSTSVNSVLECVYVRRVSRVRSKIFGGSVRDIVPEFEFIFSRTVRDINFER